MSKTRHSEDSTGIQLQQLADQLEHLQDGEFSVWRTSVQRVLDTITSDCSRAGKSAFAIGVDKAEVLELCKQLRLATTRIQKSKRPEIASNIRNLAKRVALSSPSSEQNSPPASFRDWILSEGQRSRGGQGEVAAVWHPTKHLKGALKRPRGKRSTTEQGLSRFIREVEALKATTHPFVATVLDAGTEPEPFLVTQFATFGSLVDCRDAFKHDAWRTLRLIRGVAQGLEKAHSINIVHRDIKPGNILLHSLDHPLVADFGIAHFEDKSALTQVDEKVGSYFFSPQEYELPTAEPSPSFDVFSLGAVLYWALVGDDEKSGPYRIRKVRTPIRDVVGSRYGDPIDMMLTRMLVNEPQERFQSMQEVIAAIDKIVDGSQWG